MNAKKILCAVDLSAPRKKVCAFAKAYAQATGASILVMYVTPEPVTFHGMPVEDANGNTSEDLYRKAVGALDAYIAENFPGLDVEPIIEMGNAAAAIVRIAKERGCSHVVLGTHGRKGLRRMVFGSVASKVITFAGAIPVTAIGTDE